MVAWQRRDERFVDNRYSRAHLWRFDGGTEVPASASPHVVPLPLSDPTAVDPEEAFVASLASCHMLFFLSFAARRKLVVDAYRDHAVGSMGADDAGRVALTRVTLRPHVVFGAGTAVARELLDELHHEAHEACFLARSVRTEIAVEPTFAVAD